MSTLNLAKSKVKNIADDEDLLIVERRVDPNVSHPMRRKEILEKIGLEVNGVKFSSHTFQAVVWKYDIKDKPHLCWRPAIGGSPQYSAEVISFVKKLSKQELETALREYKVRKR
jgi:hypothetical protein